MTDETIFLRIVPKALIEIASELHEFNENISLNKPEKKEIPAKNYDKPRWDEKRKAVFVPIINKFLDAKDLCVEAMSWYDAMALAKADGKKLPSKKEMLIIAYFMDEINAILEENGGEKLEGWHWTSTELSFGNSWSMYFSSGHLTYTHKYVTYYVRMISD